MVNCRDWLWVGPGCGAPRRPTHTTPCPGMDRLWVGPGCRAPRRPTPRRTQDRDRLWVGPGCRAPRRPTPRRAQDRDRLWIGPGCGAPRRPTPRRTQDRDRLWVGPGCRAPRRPTPRRAQAETDFESGLDVGHQDDSQYALSPSRERPRPHASWPAVAAHLPLSAETEEEVAPLSYAWGTRTSVGR